MFGLLAAVVRWPIKGLNLEVPETSEIAYSIIGGVAKICIYVAEFLYLGYITNSPMTYAWDALLAWFALTMLVVILLVGRPVHQVMLQ